MKMKYLLAASLLALAMSATAQARTNKHDAICTKGADDMSDHDEWISYSHWGMFTLERKSSRQSN